MADNILIGSRIKTIREEKGLTQEELAKALGLNKSTIQRYENAKIEKIKLPVIDAIAQKLNVNPEWLSNKTDVRTSYLSNEKDSLAELMQKYDNIKPIKLKRFPMLGEIACGKPIFADEDREHYIMADMDIDADFCLTAKGDSMINARIYNGDIVFIKEMPMVENGDIAAVIIEDEATLKRVYYYPEKGKLILNPENPSCEPLVYIGDELNYIRILGKAVYFMSAVE
ncbi:MAG: helix-turn-helix domain-containing protein [Ruminococcus sp.]|nr:helix-turn-helix domain-containing protein [Ruminococcus sp.]